MPAHEEMPRNLHARDEYYRRGPRRRFAEFLPDCVAGNAGSDSGLESDLERLHFTL